MEEQTNLTANRLYIDFCKNVPDYTFNVHLVNNTATYIKSIKILSGGVQSDEDTIYETSKFVKDLGELKPFSRIKIDENDIRNLCFQIWYWVDIFNETGKMKKFFALLPRGGKKENPINIELKERFGKSIQDEIKNMNMGSQRIDMKERRESAEKRVYPSEGAALIEKAIEICLEAHKGQVRKGDGKPYFIHPIMVALKLASYEASPRGIAAALTHDVLEDTDCSKDRLKYELDCYVLEMVEGLTQDNSLSWKEKKLKYIESVAEHCMTARLISAADKIHNIDSLIMAHNEQGKEVWKNFNTSREDKIWFETALLESFKRFDHPIFKEYEALVEKMKRLD